MRLAPRHRGGRTSIRIGRLWRGDRFHSARRQRCRDEPRHHSGHERPRGCESPAATPPVPGLKTGNRILRSGSSRRLVRTTLHGRGASPSPDGCLVDGTPYRRPFFAYLRFDSASPKPCSEIGMPIPASGVSKMMNMAVPPPISFLITSSCSTTSAMHPFLLHLRKGALPTSCPSILSPSPVREQHAERHHDAQQLLVLADGFVEHHRQPDIRPVLRGDALHQRAFLFLGAGRRAAAHLPGAMRSLDHAAWARGRRSAGIGCCLLRLGIADRTEDGDGERDEKRQSSRS